MKPLRLFFAAWLLLAGLGCGPDLADFDEDGILDEDDCDASNPAVYPGALDPWGDEARADTNCDGIDGVDADGDGFAGNADGAEWDCNDTNPLVYPGAVDLANDQVDQNCDGVDGVDDDGDGWASEASGGLDCDDTDPALGGPQDLDADGVTNCAGDCDDLDGFRSPALPEICDGIDNDCSEPELDGAPPDELDGDDDGSLACDDCDDNDPLLERLDIDGDGVSTCAGDCNDEAVPINPFVSDDVGDSIDQNCDGLDGVDGDGDGEASVASDGSDCADDDATITSLTDGDGDGTGYCDDCDDNDPTRSPVFTEVCENGVDDDCDGDVDTDADIDGDGFDPCTGDCNEASTATNPIASDPWSDGLDTNCDGVDGTDGDGDGYAGDAGGSSVDCDDTNSAISPADGDGDGVSSCDGDCDDADPAVFPFAGDVACDGVDSNCDEDASELDLDGDGYIPCAPFTGVVVPNGLAGGDDCDDSDLSLTPLDGDVDGYSPCDGDCDDTDSARNPGEVELACDGFDADCVYDPAEEDLDGDGEMPCQGDCDDTDPGLLGVDADFDGVTDCGPDGLPGTPDDDCDDSDNTVAPGALEQCDGLDVDCVFDAAELDQDGDGYVACSPWVGTDPSIVGEADCDDADAAVIPVDADGDGLAGCNGDCDETDATIYVGAVDLACDGLDTNCVPDPQELDVDGDGDLPCQGDCDDADATLNIADADGDGWTTCQSDCNDGDSSVYPFRADAPCDGIDSDCVLDAAETDDDGDGYVECEPWTGSAGVAGGDCDDANPLNVPIDADGDGVSGCGGDCDETDPLVFPGQVDASCDGIDTDCFVDVQELDVDGDGQYPCQGDCDDANAAVFTGALELCNGFDDDCNGSPAGVEIDNDGDGFDECSGNDCDDTQPLVNPAAGEVCDGVDNDCNGVLDDPGDIDGDGWSRCGPDGLPSTGDEDCDDADATLQYDDADNDGYVTCPGGGWLPAMVVGGDDCDDLDPTRWPGNQIWEGPFDADFDCNGVQGNDIAPLAHATIVGPPGSGAYVGSLGDLTGDGFDEVFASSGGSVLVFSGAQLAIGGTLSPSQAFATIVGVPAEEQVTAPGDVDGDGLQDIVFTTPSDIRIVLGASLAAGGTVNANAAAAYWTSAGDGEISVDTSYAGDVDGDGLDDLLFGVPGAASSAGWAALVLAADFQLATQVGVYNAAHAVFSTGVPNDQVGVSLGGVGDIDGDSLADLVVFAGPPEVGGTSWIGEGHLFLGSSLGTPGPRALAGSDIQFLAPGNCCQSVLGIGDVDGDGLDDIGFASLGLDGIYGFLANGLTLGTSRVLGTADITLSLGNGRIAGPVDIDGDGLADLLSASPTTAVAHLGAALSAGGAFAAVEGEGLFVPEAPVGSVTSVGAADVDGDGLSDLLVSDQEVLQPDGNIVSKVYIVLSPY